MAESLNIIVSHSTFRGANFKETLDLALVCAAFDHQVNLVFLDDGVYNLIKGQTSHLIDEKNHVDLLKGLSFYDIEHLYAEQQSLENRAILPNQILQDVVLLDNTALLNLNQQADRVVIL